MTPTYLLHGNLKAQEEQGEKLSAILLQAATLIKTAKGCHLYCVSQDENDKEVVWVTEIWDSADDHAASLQVDGVMDLISQAIPILAEKPTKGQELKILGGHI